MEGYELGGCRLVRRIGSGAMGEVYLAQQVRLGNRPVAVKLVPAQSDVARPPDASGDPDQSILREAQLLGRLTHPHILPVYHSGIEGGYRFLVMHYVPDGSLADAIKGRSAHRLTLPADLAFVVDLIGQVADALQYTHEHGIVHADVKPGNVLVQIAPNERWHVLLADFGISHSAETVVAHDEAAGSPAYMAPEQFYGQMSPASDQYALGVMAFQLLAGRPPFVGDLPQLVHAHLHVSPPALGAFNLAVSSAVEAVIMRALAKRPTDRYRTVAAFAEALRAAAMHSSTAGATHILIAPAFGAARRAEPPSPAAIPVRERPASATCNERLPLSIAWAPTVSVAGRGVAGQPAAPRRRAGRRRSIVVGLAAIVLLLVAGVAAIGLRSHIDLTHGSTHSSSTPPAVAGTAQTFAACRAPAGTSTLSSSPTLQLQPAVASTPEPTATDTSQSAPSPQPT